MRFLENKEKSTFSWTVGPLAPVTLRTFLKNKGISKRLLAKIKFQGGEIRVNGRWVTVLEKLNEADVVEVDLPIEKDNTFLVPSHKEIVVLFEDEHYLVVNKPAGVAAVPSATHKTDTMANRIKGYLLTEAKKTVAVHVVTRLDRDTSGAMLFAKHPFAHAQLDKQLRKKEVDRQYIAIAEGAVPGEVHAFINQPIARSEDSIITRRVHASGKEALTEYWIVKRTKEHTLMEVKLHTGRTHQIRVHFASVGYPLVGDDLYGGTMKERMQRQALHCKAVRFQHPFKEAFLHIEAPLPLDLAEYVKTF